MSGRAREAKRIRAEPRDSMSKARDLSKWVEIKVQQIWFEIRVFWSSSEAETDLVLANEFN